ncbi:MAG: 30S ribosomal protein S4 [Candidatus Pacebacteria bacterium]|nr:30S ribosomal protein S4 [Candidatus Paceibacterota bacterium]MCD8507877.1 30S ribosomal protein S4 [Candidatus Paceibacterota bacterium]MCD8527950.1 30S ribosomal protein S4 [Candidatus Paceibacterota bacterium]MCD8563934.1 30S ribosomal protein S4 [Candidatus Paceibacterota bacterium]
MAIFKPKKFKIARRLGAGIYEKTQGQKFLLSQAKKDKNLGRPKRVSDYGRQLIEKQKVRFMYGVREKQFRNYVEKALAQKSASTPAMRLFILLESRLDNVVYRLGLAPTRGAARQMTSHGHIMVNGKRSKVPSQLIKKDDIITIREGSKDSVMFAEIKEGQVPQWLVWDNTKKQGKVTGIPATPDAMLDFQSVIEFYSRT